MKSPVCVSPNTLWIFVVSSSDIWSVCQDRAYFAKIFDDFGDICPAQYLSKGCDRPACLARGQALVQLTHTTCITPADCHLSEAEHQLHLLR